MPATEAALEVDPNLIMHVSLPIGDQQVLMGSDVPEAMGEVDFGNSVNPYSHIPRTGQDPSVPASLASVRAVSADDKGDNPDDRIRRNDA